MSETQSITYKENELHLAEVTMLDKSKEWKGKDLMELIQWNLLVIFHNSDKKNN